MKEFKDLDATAINWLADKPPTQWSKSHFQIFPKTDMLLNNLCESFNSMILDARDKPIISMLERIRSKLTRRISLNITKMLQQDSLLCPKIELIFGKVIEEATHCVPEWSGTPKFEVNGLGGKFVCDLDTGTCACRRWYLTGIPCKHAVAVIYFFGLDPQLFVDKCYHRETYLSCYENCIFPLNGPQLWPKIGMDHITPPIYKPLKGRAHKGARRPEEDEKKKKTGADPFKLSKKYQQSLKCTNCGTSGHNKRSCKQPLNEETGTVKKGKGRPKQPNEENAERSQAPKKKRKYTKSTKPKVKHTFKAQMSTQASEGNVETQENVTSERNVATQEVQGNIATQGSQSTTAQAWLFAMNSMMFHGKKVYFKSGLQPNKQKTPPTQ